MPMSTPERPQPSIADSQRNFLALSIPTSASRDSPRLSSDATGLQQSHKLQSNEPTLSRGLVDNAAESDELEDGDRLGIPAPITKSQPSWDPFNATPIAEEDGFQFDERAKQHLQAMPSAPKPTTLAALDEAGSKSTLSNSGDAEFHDAHEEPSDISDWVIVSSAEAKPVQLKAVSEHVPNPEQEQDDYRPPEGPPPSFLKRQQTQPSPEPEITKAPQQSAIDAMDQSQTPPKPGPETEPEVYQPPEGPPPSFLMRQQKEALIEPKIGKAPDLNTNGPSQSQEQPNLKAEVLSSTEQPSASVLNRPRFSYEVPVQSQAPTQVSLNTSNYPPREQNFVHSQDEQQHQERGSDEPSRNTSFKGLPPIRRSSTFGLGFGPRKGKQRFPIDDEEELSPPQDNTGFQNYESEIGATAGAATVAAYANHDQTEQPHQIHHTTASINLAEQRKASMDLARAKQSELNRTGSPDYSQRDGKPQPERQPDFEASRAADLPQDGFRRSQDAWRPNVISPTAQTSPSGNIGVISPPRRPSIEKQRSLESQRNRALSDASQTAQRPDIQYNDRGPRPIVNQPIRPALYDQPPSSAQRYPELFQTQQPSPPDLGRDGDLPPHMYQAPISREAAFLPRQQTNEYQLPGVGPPVDEPRPDRSRRNSASFFKEIGGRISRGTSRERGNSVSRDEATSPPGRPIDSRGYEYPESSIASDEAQEQQKRRSSFFGSLNRASTTGLGPPQSRESTVAHFPGSRTDLLGTPQQSPVGDRKRSFFGAASPSSPKVKANKLSRSSTSGMPDEPGKKKRFSGLSSMFSRTGNPSSRTSLQDHPQSVKQLSSNERQPLESPQFDQRQSPRPPPPAQNNRGPSQQRQFLTKLSTGGDPSKPREESKTRRPSASTLLSGIIGRKSENKDHSKEDSSSQGTRSQASQRQYLPHQVPLGQTYTDLQEESPHALSGPAPQQMPQPQPMRHQGSSHQAQPQERGRRVSREPPRELPREPPREPQYDSVPIPGGYQLVRGDGAMTAPTDYDPRGLGRFQQGPQIDQRYMQQQQSRGIYPQNQPSIQGGPQRASYQKAQLDPRTSQGSRPPALSAVESYESYTKRTSPRLSREELLARSPAREQLDQQRPYQLSLPENEDDRDHHLNRLSKSTPVVSPPGSMRSTPTQNAQQSLKKHDPIQRLQQPILRHPQSPAGYPLPDDAVFSPINEAAHDVPPPPPPKWPSHLDAQHGHNPNQHLSSQHLNLESELDRSNTRRTAISAVSGMSGPQSAGLHPPMKESEGGAEITPSPSPPSPAYTPEREQSPPRYSVDEKELERGLSEAEKAAERGQMLGDRGRIRTTQLSRGPSPDLYNASPRLPPTNQGFDGQQRSNHRNSNLGNSNGNSNGNVHASPSSQHVQGPPSSAENDPARKRLAELERQKRKAQEEKIYYDAETGEEGHHEEEAEGVAMSATSYPGQEWNPYLAGGYEDFD